MKTSELAKGMKDLTAYLETLNDIDVKDLKKQTAKKFETRDVAVNLYTLLQLSKIKKSEWLDLIKEFNFNIKLDYKASSRDIIGKILTYLEKNPEAQNTLKSSFKKKGVKSGGRSSLTSALDLILGENYGTEE